MEDKEEIDQQSNHHLPHELDDLEETVPNNNNNNNGIDLESNYEGINGTAVVTSNEQNHHHLLDHDQLEVETKEIRVLLAISVDADHDKKLVVADQSEKKKKKKKKAEEEKEAAALMISSSHDEKLVKVVKGGTTGRGGKQIKAKSTVPQPFSLATEKRMSLRERRRELMDEEEHPLLINSTTTTNRRRTRTSEGVQSSTQLRNGTAVAAKSTSQCLRPVDKTTDQKNQQEEKELEIKKPSKSSTLKASPLPSFNRKAHQKPELKKIPLTSPKSPPLHRGNKSISETLHRRSKSISELSNNKMEVSKKSKSVLEPGNNEVDAITKNGSKSSVLDITKNGSKSSVLESGNSKVDAITKNGSKSSVLDITKNGTKSSVLESGNSKVDAITKNGSKTISVSAMTSESRTTMPKSIHRRSKSIPDLGNNKIEVFNRSKSICKSENYQTGGIAKNGSRTTTVGAAASSESRTTKPEAIHKSTSRTISSSAKETINRLLLRGSWKTSNKQKGESGKVGKSCGDRLGKDGVISPNEAKGLAIKG